MKVSTVFILVLLVAFGYFIFNTSTKSLCIDGRKCDTAEIALTYYENGSYELSGRGLYGNLDLGSLGKDGRGARGYSYQPADDFCRLYFGTESSSFSQLVFQLERISYNLTIQNESYPYTASVILKSCIGVGGCSVEARAKSHAREVFDENKVICQTWSAYQTLNTSGIDAALEICGTNSNCRFKISVIGAKIDPRKTEEICPTLQYESNQDICYVEAAHYLFNDDLEHAAGLCEGRNCDCSRFHQVWDDSLDPIISACFTSNTDTLSWLCRCAGSRLIKTEEFKTFAVTNKRAAREFCNLQTGSNMEKCLEIVTG